MDIQRLEPEFLGFINENIEKYGQPLMYCTAGETQEEKELIEKHYQKQQEFLGCCAPAGVACPCNICCWTCLFPFALYNCIQKVRKAKEEAVISAQDILSQRHVIFPTMLVTFFKSSGIIKEMKVLEYADHQEITPEFWNDMLDAENDMINGAIHGAIVPAVPGVLIFTGETRQVFTGGDRRDPRNWETRRTPSIKRIVSQTQGKDFCDFLKKVVREDRQKRQ